MSLPFQPRLFNDFDESDHQSDDLRKANLGTFQDSLSAPIHSWFTYPAGFSYKAVEYALDAFHIQSGMTVYDPFAGTGTTNVVASQRGVRSYGVEAHPFVNFVGRTKLYWDFDLAKLRADIDALIESVRRLIRSNHQDVESLETVFPELVRKCYSPEKLLQFYHCREAVQKVEDRRFQDFAKLGLTYLLRSAADVATGWPYIAPQKAKKVSNNHQNVPDLLRNQLYRMWTDIQTVRSLVSEAGQATFIWGDARAEQAIGNNSVDLAFTSPPYLNNYDYADRTRLEMYFWGEVKTWGDITDKVRGRLMMSATTQINRSRYDSNHLLSSEVVAIAPEIAHELDEKTRRLSVLRLEKGGKKSYDILVAGYFNDMLRVLQETYRVLKPGSAFVLILGDSAPYGVYVPTHTYLGEIGRGIGFTNYRVEQLRTRGDKWKGNPQRHKVPLQECILTLHKN